MAIRRVAVDDSGNVMLELSAKEYATILRALQKAYWRAGQIGATADQREIEKLLTDLQPIIRSGRVK